MTQNTTQMKTKAGVHTIICVCFSRSPLWFLSVCKHPASSQAKTSKAQRSHTHTHIPSPWVNQILFSLFLFLLHPLLANRTMYLCLPELAAIGLAVHETLPRGVGLVDHLLKGV
jgi:hypothetical protein